MVSLIYFLQALFDDIESIQNGISAMEMCSQQKLNGNWTVLTAITNLNSHSIDSSYRNQTKCYPQPKLYHQGIVHNEIADFCISISFSLSLQILFYFIGEEHVLTIN